MALSPLAASVRPALTAQRDTVSLLRSYFQGLERESSKSLLTRDYSDRIGPARVDAFTNESGLDGLLENVAKSAPRGGAAVGVSGSLLDVASRLRSELVVSLDANPKVAAAMGLFQAVLLEADREAKALGLSSPARAQRVQSLLKLESTGDVEALYQSVNRAWPAEKSAELRKLIQSVQDSKELSEDVGAVKNWLTSADAPERIEHLTQLAREGRILAITASLDDAAAIERINRILSAHGTDASVFNLSNVLDYGANGANRDTLRALGQLRTTPDAQVISSLAHIRSLGPRKIDGRTQQTLSELGTVAKPAALPARQLFGDTEAAYATQLAKDRHETSLLPPLSEAGSLMMDVGSGRIFAPAWWRDRFSS
ncbi:MAG: LIC_10091 family protein [Myxococcaceae bacterium]